MLGQGSWVSKAIVFAAVFDFLLITYIGIANLHAAFPAPSDAGAIAVIESGGDVGQP